MAHDPKVNLFFDMLQIHPYLSFVSFQKYDSLFSSFVAVSFAISAINAIGFNRLLDLTAIGKNVAES
jgi:hypothetical protein